MKAYTYVIPASKEKVLIYAEDMNEAKSLAKFGEKYIERKVRRAKWADEYAPAEATAEGKLELPVEVALRQGFSIYCCYPCYGSQQNRQFTLRDIQNEKAFLYRARPSGLMGVCCLECAEKHGHDLERSIELLRTVEQMDVYYF